MQFTVNNKYYLSKYGGVILFSAIFVFALFIRVYKLDERPMHVDEAVNAIKFGELLENNNYKYDPAEYHGPSLYYFTLVLSFITGQENISEVNETSLRLVTVIAGLLLLCSLFLLKGFENKFLITALIFFSFSAVNVFYNRYFIHESLFVSFSFAGLFLLYRYLITQNILHLILCAALFALAFATKETIIITFFSMFLSLLILKFLPKKYSVVVSINRNHVMIFLFVFAIISVLFFSSFFLNPKGIVDSLTTFTNYFTKAGNNKEHAHAFYYYFQNISFINIGGILYSEFIVVILYLFGSWLVFTSEEQNFQIVFCKFMALFAALMAIIYSIIPYKTPWLMMSFWQGMLLIAAFGFYQLSKYFSKGFWYLMLLLIAILFFVQAYYVAITHSSNPQNPFAYSQSLNCVVTFKKQLSDIAETQKDKYEIPIYVAAPKNNYWPLPWYLKDFTNVSWNNKITTNASLFPIILCSLQLESELIQNLYNLPSGKSNLYIPLFENDIEIRQGVFVRGYIRKDNYDTFINSSNQ